MTSAEKGRLIKLRRRSIRWPIVRAPASWPAAATTTTTATASLNNNNKAPTWEGERGAFGRYLLGRPSFWRRNKERAHERGRLERGRRPLGLIAA